MVLLPESGKAVLVSWTPKKVSPEKFLYPHIGTTPLIAGVSGVEDQFNLLPMCLTRHRSSRESLCSLPLPTLNKERIYGKRDDRQRQRT